MGKVRQYLKKTPVRTMYYWFRGLPPIKACLRFRARKRRDHLMFNVLPKIYNAHLDDPIDENKIIFVEKKAAKLTNSYTYIYQVLKEQYNYDIHVHYLRSGYVRRKEYVKNCCALMEDLATAKYIFVNDTVNIMGSFNRREGQQIVQLWHACGAFKCFGMSIGDKLFGLSAEEQRLERPHFNYTRAVVSSENIKWAYNEAFDYPKDSDIVQALGISRTDIFYDEHAKNEAYHNVKKAFPAIEGKKIILFAPTFRGRVNMATTPMPDLDKFYQAFGQDYVIIIKHHPFIKELPEIPAKYKGTFAYDATNTLTIEDLLFISDICISDYSSLIFEYSLFTRPMLFYAYDLEEYFDWRGFYYPYEELTPGPICRTNEEMIDYIQHIDERFDPEVVKQFREKFMGACDGHATQRILEDTMGVEELAKHRKKG